MSTTKKLVTCAMLVALGTVLSLIHIWNLPNGGTITAASMVPIVIIPYLFGFRYGIISAFVFALLEMIALTINTPPSSTFLNWTLVVFLDYILAFTVLGLGTLFTKNAIIGSVIVVFLRLVCHFVSGIIVWGVFAAPGQSVLAYSAIYNASFMIPEMIITAVVVAILVKIPGIPWAAKQKTLNIPQ